MSFPTDRRFFFGRILKIQPREGRGQLKHRTGIILTPTDQFTDRDEFQVIVCSTKIKEYPSPYNVWIPGGKFKGIDRNVVAVHDWIETIPPSQVLELGGLLWLKYTKEILEKQLAFQAALGQPAAEVSPKPPAGSSATQTTTGTAEPSRNPPQSQ